MPPEARYAYTICSGQTHFRDVFIEDMWYTFRLMWSLLSPIPTPPKKLFEFCKSHDLPFEVGWARAHLCPTMAMPLGGVLAWLCLGQGADLHMIQLMPLPLTISCSSKSRLVLPFWCRFTRVVPDKVQEGRKTVVCV